MKGVPKNSPWRLQEHIDKAVSLQEAIMDPTNHSIFPLNKRGKKVRNETERTTIHAPVVQWIDEHIDQYPALAFAFHTPTEGRRGFKGQQTLRDMGVRPGVPDLMWPIALGVWHGLALEFKMPGEKPTPKQAKFLRYLRHCGWFADVCYDAGQAIAMLQALATNDRAYPMRTTMHMDELDRIAARDKTNSFTDTAQDII